MTGGKLTRFDGNDAWDTIKRMLYLEYPVIIVKISKKSSYFSDLSRNILFHQ